MANETTIEADKFSLILNAVLKGLGQRPTSHLLRWYPTFKNPARFDLLEVFRCEADGEVVTIKISQSPLGLHAGHKIIGPSRFTLWEWLKVQLRLIR